jgi:hypothetical protein
VRTTGVFGLMAEPAQGVLGDDQFADQAEQSIYPRFVHA